MSKFRWVVPLLALVLLVGCDDPSGGEVLEVSKLDAQVGPVFVALPAVAPENQLPDATFDWRGRVGEALASGRCDVAVWLLYGAYESAESDLEEFAERLEREPACATEATRVSFVVSLIRSDLDVPPTSLAVDVGGTIEVFPRTRFTYALHPGLRDNISLPTFVADAEAYWLARCELPMGLPDANPYSLRLIAASIYPDEELRIPAWDARTEECRGELNNLFNAYRRWQDETESARERNQIELILYSDSSYLFDFIHFTAPIMGEPPIFLGDH